MTINIAFPVIDILVKIWLKFNFIYPLFWYHIFCMSQVFEYNWIPIICDLPSIF